MGGVLGLGIGAYAAQLLAFAVGYWLLKRIGMRSIVLFLAHFDRDTVKSPHSSSGRRDDRRRGGRGSATASSQPWSPAASAIGPRSRATGT